MSQPGSLRGALVPTGKPWRRSGEHGQVEGWSCSRISREAHRRWTGLSHGTGIARRCCCCTGRERGWGAKGMLVMPPSTAASPFQPRYAFKVSPSCPQKTRQRNCSGSQMEPFAGPVGRVSALGSRQGQWLRGERVSLPLLICNPNSTHLSCD